MKKFWPVAAVIIAIASGIAIGFYVHKPKTDEKPTATSQKQAVPVPVTSTQPKPATYRVGDTQSDGNLNFTLVSTNFATTMGHLAPTNTIFAVNITVKNNGSTPFTSKDAFVNQSSVYTQVGSDVSTGKYNPAYTSPCFGGGDVIVPPGQTVSGCVQFVVPQNASIDTYFYGDLKWYL